MSLTITVRQKDMTTGGETKQLPAEGDNGNQEIDTKAEAEAALTYLTDDKFVAVVGERSYTRAQLIEIRDRKDAPAAEGEKVPGDGMSHGVLLGGSRTSGIGDHGHTGNRLTLAYMPGIPLSGPSKDDKGKWTYTLDGILGLTFGSHSRNYMTPGGEPVESGFRTYAVTPGAHLRITPPSGDKRFYVTPGVRFHVGKFTTPDGGSVSLPPSCSPGDFGRAECEPNAGPRTGNAGTSGLWNKDLGAARETSGLLIGFDALAGLGYRIVKGGSTSIDAQGGFIYSMTHLSPSDGHGLTSSGMGGFLEVIARFGGSDAYVPQKKETPPPAAVPPPPPPADKDGDGVPDAEDKCPEVKGVKENFGCLAFEAKIVEAPTSVKSTGAISLQLEVSTKSEVSVQLRGADGKLYNIGSTTIDKGKSVNDFQVPANVPAGKYKLVVTMKDANTKVEKVEERDIAVVERVEWTLPGSFAPGQPPAAQDVRVVGQTKLEGVGYVITAFDKDGKQVGESKVTDKPGNLEDKKGTRIAFKAPEINGKAVGWQKEITYRVTLVNRDGNPLDTKSFEMGQAAPAPKGGGRKRL